MRKTLLPLALGLAVSAFSARADVIVNFEVNTTSLAGTDGYVDFQFNPGNASQSATVKVTNFSGATYVAGSQTDVGGASGGPLPSTVSIVNSGGYNDDNEEMKFGNALLFTLDFSGNAISSPNGTPGTSGSSFAFTIYDAATDSNPLLPSTNVNGYAAVVNVGTNGSVTASTPSSDATVTPEPASWLMMGSGAVALLGVYRRRRA